MDRLNINMDLKYLEVLNDSLYKICKPKMKRKLKVKYGNGVYNIKTNLSDEKLIKDGYIPVNL